MFRDRFQWGLMAFGGAVAVALLSLELTSVPSDTPGTQIQPAFKVTFSRAYAHHPCCCLYDDGTLGMVDEHEQCEDEGGKCVAKSRCEDARSARALPLPVSRPAT